MHPKDNRFTFIFVIFTYILVFSFLAMAKEKIRWASPIYDPYIILEGPDKGKGISDEITKLLQANLQEYEHEQMTANVLRMESELQSGKNFCAPQMIRSAAREKFTYFSSVPSTISPAPALVVKKSTLAKFRNSKRVSLAEVLDNESLTLGIIKGRVYGKGIDDVLKKHERSKKIYSRVSGDVYQGLLQMLNAGRLDMIIGTPLETYYLAKKFGIPNDIAIIRINETNDYFMGYSACPKTPWGFELIKKIDKILIRERPSAKYRSFFERYMPEDLVEDYRRAYNTMFLGIK